jgi:hypothetical protein
MARMQRRQVQYGELKRPLWAGGRALELIEKAAEADGVSFSQFVREAALAQAIYLEAGGAAGEQSKIAGILDELRRDASTST